MRIAKRLQHSLQGGNNYALPSASWILTPCRWAAKEAVRKACEHLGSSNGFHSIIILPIALSKLTPGATSRPQALILRNRLPEPPKPSPQATVNHDISFDIESLDGQLCEVSISHDSKYASAVALVPVVEEWQS
jgi:holo-[acyl-carrier protein] synthase